MRRRPEQAAEWLAERPEWKDDVLIVAARTGRLVQLRPLPPESSEYEEAAGLLCGRTGFADVIDASVAVVAAALVRREDVTVVTSDSGDLGRLLAALDADVRLEPVGVNRAQLVGR